jgi:hypothetical protein
MQKQTSLIKLKEKRKYNPFLTTREKTLLCIQAPCLLLETCQWKKKEQKYICLDPARMLVQSERREGWRIEFLNKRFGRIYIGDQEY